MTDNEQRASDLVSSLEEELFLLDHFAVELLEEKVTEALHASEKRGEVEALKKVKNIGDKLYFKGFKDGAEREREACIHEIEVIRKYCAPNSGAGRKATEIVQAIRSRSGKGDG